MIENIEPLIEDINRASISEHAGDFAITSTQEMSVLIESGNPIYKVRGEYALFGYNKPIPGIVFNKLSKDQALAWFDALEEDIQPDPAGDGACEVYEISPIQWEKLLQIVKGTPLPVDPDINWLAEAGLVEARESGNFQATQLGRQWAGLSRQ